MSEVQQTTMESVARALDELTRELRRQGRAAIAAQAAAESCLEVLEGRADASASGARDDGAWLSALIPVADALDRVVAQGLALAALPRAAVQRGLWPFRRAEPPQPDREMAALGEGLRVLRAQLQAALEGLGVSIDRRTGVAVDPEVHRVVEVRKSGPREVVVEVVRPGYRLGERVVREAEVVVERRT
jgi:molecular chaperone GrpE